MDFSILQNHINTCSENPQNKFYVYELWDPIKNEVFYVGKGEYRRRYYRYTDHIKEAAGLKKLKGRNFHKLNRIKSILNQRKEPIIKIVYESPDENKAFDKEKELILLYGRRDLKTGTLTNLTGGGDGVSGRIYTLGQRQKISQRITGSGNPMYGKKHSIKAIQAMSQARQSRAPYKHTQKWKDYLKEHCHLAANARPICQIDFNGNVINTFPSAKKAGEILKIGRNNLSTCCKIKHHSINNHYWRYADDPDLINGKLHNVDLLNKKRTTPCSSKKVFQINLKNKIIREWPSILEVERTTGTNHSELYYSLNKNRIVSGSYWRSA